MATSRLQIGPRTGLIGRNGHASLKLPVQQSRAFAVRVREAVLAAPPAVLAVAAAEEQVEAAEGGKAVSESQLVGSGKSVEKRRRTRSQTSSRY